MTGDGRRATGDRGPVARSGGRAGRGLFFSAFALACVLGSPVARRPSLLLAQVSPHANWRTIVTPHFYVHFTPELEPLARRIAGDAERAYDQLATELHPPRGKIDVVLSDDVDFSNGSATPYPTNRIVIYANPPVNESALRYTNDWGQLVITHELTHIFHLDRVRGVWRLGQYVFGRAPMLFPNFYSPLWLTEGLAVHFESRFTGAGRIEGSEHRMIARSAATEHRFPPLSSVSAAAGRFPFGETVYAYGSLFVDYVAKTRGEDKVREFVDKASAQIIPYFIDRPARHSFGISFTNAYRLWRDSLVRSSPSRPSPTADRPLPDWHELTRDGVFVSSPRWLSDSTVVYTGAPGRESYGAFTVDINGHRTRVGRRNSRSPNVRLADGSLLFAQLDFVNPFQDRSDLVVQRGGRERRLTKGARLTTPDVRADGSIVASQIIPGGTRLVRVSRDGKVIVPLTTGSYDEQWTEPRWSSAGDRIVASRWLRGNVSQVVVIDTTGRIIHVVSSGHSIEATPSWLPGDTGIIYASDRTGSAQVYLERFDDPRELSRSATYRLSDVYSGLFEPQSAPREPRAAAVVFRSDGFHLGVGRCCPTDGEPVPAYRDTSAGAAVPPVVAESAAVRRYSPWRTLVPRYWIPTVSEAMHNGYYLGASTSGSDVVGRHAFAASIGVPTNNTGVVAAAAYRFGGFGLPIIDASATQDWSYRGHIFDRDPKRTILGELRRRVRDGDLLATWIHQRYRSAFSLTGGVGVEHRDHFTLPSGLASQVDTAGSLGSPTFPRLEVGAGFANYQRPPFSISPEDGVSLTFTVRDRLRSGEPGRGSYTLSTVGVGSLYKSLDLPGFAHHVLALRVAGGYADERSNGYYEVGGTSGSTFQIIPGYSVGEGRRTFGVRGFAPATLVGIRALAASAEYRIPLVLAGRGLGWLPFFLDRSSLTAFTDFGTAWCPTARSGREVCVDPNLTRHYRISSAGAELNFNLGVLSFDQAYRFRLGVAAPTLNRAFFNRPNAQVYFTAGASF